MTFQEMLDSRGRALIEKWRDEIYGSYPAYSRGFMQKQKIGSPIRLELLLNPRHKNFRCGLR